MIAAFSTTGPVSAGAQGSQLGDYYTAPVFFELYGAHYTSERSLEALRAGRVQVYNYDPVPLDGFDWTGGIDDFTWWVTVEELRWLLPFIASDDAEERDVARRIMWDWHHAHPDSVEPNTGAWYPMTVAWRVMVMAYFLKTEEERPEKDDALLGMLRERIYEHQQKLLEPGNFEDRSNHGLVQGVALLESTRVIPDSDTRATGLQRLLHVAKVSVSDLGSHMEHSPQYHFVFLRWLDQFVDYLQLVPSLASPELDALTGVREKMRRVGYYYQDHAGVYPPIGDSEPDSVADVYGLPYPEPGEPSFHDPQAGFAVFKGRGDDRRYVVFANQNKRPRLKFHYHDDVLSVFFNDDGETILGDQGRYHYTWDDVRRYFFSPQAHNTVFPYSRLESGSPRYAIYVAAEVWADVTDTAVTYGGVVLHREGKVKREVTIPLGGRGVAVTDTIRGARPAGSPRKLPPQYDTEVRRGVMEKRLAMTWNMGSDVADITQVDTGDGNRFEWRLMTKRGRAFAMTVTVDAPGGDAGVELSTVVGRESPLLGWQSPEFGRRVPSTVLLFALRPWPALYITTTVEPARPPAPWWLRLVKRGY